MNQTEELSLLERQIASSTKRLVSSMPIDNDELVVGVSKATVALVHDPNVPRWAIDAWRVVGERVIHMARVVRLTEEQ